MKKIFLIILSITFVNSTYAQITFQKTYGGTGYDYGTSVKQASDDGFIIVGYTDSYGAGNEDVYLIKTDNAGDTVWTKFFGGAGNDEAWAVEQTNDGGYIITGTTSGLLPNSGDVFLIKTDSLGNSIWTKTYEGPNDDEGFSVKQTTDGGYVICGYTTSFGAGNYDVYVIRTNSLGDTLWSKTYGGSFDDYGYSVQQTDDGGFIIGGSASSFASGNLDAFLVKTDNNGDTLWSKAIDITFNEEIFSVQQTDDGGYIASGYTAAFGHVAVLIKTDSTGNVLWTKSFHGYEGDMVVQTADYGYVFAGIYINDVYIVKTDSSGNLTWSKSIGGSSLDGALAIQQTADGGYIISGCTESFGTGQQDVYLIKTDSSGVSGCNEITNFDMDILQAFQETTPVPLITSPMTIVSTPLNVMGNGGITTPVCLATETMELPAKEHFSDISFFPNPVYNSTTISFSLSKAQKCSLKLFDINGRLVATLADKKFEEGENEILLNAYDVKAGIYFLQFQSMEILKTEKLIVTK